MNYYLGFVGGLVILLYLGVSIFVDIRSMSIFVYKIYFMCIKNKVFENYEVWVDFIDVFLFLLKFCKRLFENFKVIDVRELFLGFVIVL